MAKRGRIELEVARVDAKIADLQAYRALLLNIPGGRTSEAKPAKAEKPKRAARLQTVEGAGSIDG